LLVDFLCIFDETLQQRWWRVAEELTQIVEDELSVRPVVPSVTFEDSHRDSCRSKRPRNSAELWASQRVRWGERGI